MSYYELTVHEIASKIKNKEIKIKDVLDEIFNRIDKIENNINAYVTITKKQAYARAEIIQRKIDNGEEVGVLAGVPIAIKDNICTENVKTTCSSKMLENFIAPYDATVIKKLIEADAIIIGKTNLDEFAMGSSTENSAFKKTTNPWDEARVPGGSSGGSCAAVASDMAFAALGTDTGGSIRQPSAYCGIVGIKPTYGTVSRYGVVAFASSLDQVGPCVKDVEDAAIMLNVITGHDEMDTTSVDIDYPDYTKALKNDIKGMKIGIPTNFIGKGISDDVIKAFNDSKEQLKNLGAEIIEIELSMAKYALPTYYIIATAEASSNLAKFDGIRYGYRAKDFNNLDELYKKSRTEGFGEEVKRRIMLGTYVLSSGYYDAYYKRAGQVRTLIINDFKKAFEQVDTIVIPTVPNTAFKFNEKASNPVEMYLEDIFTVPVNIAGLPGISIPCGFDKNNMPIGLQFIAPSFREDVILNVAYAYEQNTKFHSLKPKIKDC